MSDSRSNSIVRWGALALILATAACAGDSVTAPEAANDIQAITADAKGGKGANKGADNVVFEPQRYKQIRVYNSGFLSEFGETNADPVIRQCQLNSYEDRDGNDYVHVDQLENYRKEHVNESHGFVMVQEFDGTAWNVTHIGRANWSGQFWFDAATGGTTTFVNSHARGVVLPVLDAQGNDRADGELDELLFWLNEAEEGTADYQPGSWYWMSSADYLGLATPLQVYVGDPLVDDSVMVGSRNAPHYDLLNDPLGIIPIHPDDNIVGQEARAVDRLSTLMARYEDELHGVECDADYTSTKVQENEIVFTNQWPKQLNKLFRGF